MHEPGPHASSAKSTTTSHPVGQPPEAEGAHDQTGNDLGTRGEGSARPPRPSELPVAGDRTCHPVVTKYSSLDQDAGSRPAIGQGQASSRGGTSEQEGLADAELSKYLVDDQNLLWLECECVGVSARKTSVLAVPQCLVPDLLASGNCQHGHPGRLGRCRCCETHSNRQVCVGTREITCFVRVQTQKAVTSPAHSHAAGQVRGVMEGAGRGLPNISKHITSWY